MEDLQTALDKATMLLSVAGCHYPVQRLPDKERIVESAIRFLVLKRTETHLQRYIFLLRYTVTFQVTRNLCQVTVRHGK
jgi:hypothetical protein